jgi:hypothetical protein
MWKKERQIEQRRRRAQLKVSLIKHPESTPKVERPWERWDWWCYD